MTHQRLPTITCEARPDATSPRMTRGQAARYGRRTMPRDLKVAGFKVAVFRATMEANGWDGFRVSYGR